MAIAPSITPVRRCTPQSRIPARAGPSPPHSRSTSLSPAERRLIRMVCMTHVLDGEASAVCRCEVRFVRRETGGRRTSHLFLAGCTPLVPLVGGPCSSAAHLRRSSANVGRVCVACAKCDLQVLSLGECRGCMRERLECMRETRLTGGVLLDELVRPVHRVCAG